MISGTQGEPMSALSRAAVNNHKYAHIDAGDTVVLSSRVIPGNEKSIYRMIDHLERRDAKVIHDDGTQGLIHVSGHGSQEELRLMINLLRPKFFVPIHGDYRHLKRHAELAGNMDIVEKVILLEDGEILDLDKTSATKSGKITVGRVCIDAGGSIDVVEDVVIRDRQHISEGGIVLPIITINKRTGAVENFPEIVMRGFAVDDPAMISESRAGRPAHPRELQRRREARLRRHQGKDPQRPQALHPEEHQPPPAHHARHPRNLRVPPMRRHSDPTGQNLRIWSSPHTRSPHPTA